MPSIDEMRVQHYMQMLRSALQEDLPLEELAVMVQQVRQQLPRTQHELLDRLLLEELLRLQAGVSELSEKLTQVKDVIEQLKLPPLTSALFLEALPEQPGRQALVSIGGARRVVNVMDEVPLEELGKGDEVFLTGDLSTLICRAPHQRVRGGEIAAVKSVLDDGMVLLETRDGDYLVEQTARLQETALKPGDRVLWEQASRLAFTTVESPEGNEFIIEAVEDVPLALVGGLSTELAKMVSTLRMRLTAPDIARKWRVPSKSSILLYGPPGCGKTHMTRAAAAEIRRRSDCPVTLAVPKPGQFENMYVGETQRRIRECFSRLREASQGGISMIFLDEVDSIARTRGQAFQQHHDSFLGALLAEIEGFVSRGERMAIIAATNKKSLLDSAYVSRFGTVIPINRPRYAAAREIFGIHLPDGLPYAEDDATPEQARQALIETALSLIYAPNCNLLCELRCRDGSTRQVRASDLIDGRTIAMLCEQVLETAALREEATGECCLTRQDVEQALVGMLAEKAATLSPANIHDYLMDLPQDNAVVAVQCVYQPSPSSMGLRVA